MISSLSTAASGMVAQSTKQDVIANNIANAQTAGFKRRRVATSSFAQALEQTAAAKPGKSVSYPNSPVKPLSVASQTVTDASEGPIHPTGNELDFAIDGPGGFEVQSGGKSWIQRGGALMLNGQRELCTSTGEVVQGRSGAIRLPQGKVDVTSDGTILADGAEVDQIKLVGGGSNTSVVQGSLESSNVNVVGEMVEMITNMRSFEANQKMVIAIDHTLDKLINEAGKV